jgi:UrcA family protein
MTRLAFKIGLPLMMVVAAASAMAVAQQADTTHEITVRTGRVDVTPLASDDGIPTERFRIERVVSYANLDLSTSSGAAELNKRVRQAALDACKELVNADPIDLSDEDGRTTCVKQATEGAMTQVNAAITTARTTATARAINEASVSTEMHAAHSEMFR